jgi:gliding motility-associated-like protein
MPPSSGINFLLPWYMKVLMRGELPLRKSVLLIMASFLLCAMLCSFQARSQDGSRGNRKPKIVGQQELRTVENQSIRIELNDLFVEDKDDWFYPLGFTLHIHDGVNYSVNGNVVTPKASFYGNLTVPVSVNDGEDESDIYNLLIQVEGSNDAPVITGQQPVIINEDGNFTIELTHLNVSDPDNNYPADFTMTISQGNNYSLNGKTITPSPNYNGSIIVPVTVSDGEKTSNNFNFQITIKPINDAPKISLEGNDTLYFKTGGAAVPLVDLLTISDIDNRKLSFAEVAYSPEQYESGKDFISFTNTDSIKGVFDAQRGVLTLIGSAPVAAYVKALKSVMIDLQKASPGIKSVYFTVNDGEASSNKIVRPVKISSQVFAFEIPNGFTPNGDNVNDTWSVRSLKGDADFQDVVIRVYAKSGQMVFEGNGLNSEWDGQYHGSNLPADVYYYTVSFNNSDTQSPVRGIVTILR